MRFRVRVKKTLRCEDSNEELDGLTDPHLRTIWINGELDSVRRWSTLLHEVIHAGLHAGGLSYQIADDDAEEAIVRFTEHALEEFLLQYGREYLDVISARSYREPTVEETEK